MKRLILSLFILFSMISFTSCGNIDRVYGTVVKTEVTDTIKGGQKVGGHMSFFFTSDQFINQVTIKISDGSEKTFEIKSNGRGFSQDLVGDSVFIDNGVYGNSLGHVVIL